MKSTRWPLGLLAAALVVWAGPTAAQVGVAEADLNGDGRPEGVELRPAGEGRLALHVGGVATEATVVAEGLRGDDAALRRVDLGRGRGAGIYRVPRADGAAFEAVLHVSRRGAAPTLVWSGLTGLRGDRGSRWGDRIVVEDLTGDGVADLVVASVADEVPLCGVTEPELFPRALHPARGKLVPVLLNRLRRLETEAVPLEGSRQSPGPAGPPVVTVASFATASTLLGDRGMVEGLAAPRAVADGDPATAWVEGRSGPGTHEFLTARLLPGPYRVRAVALILSPGGEERSTRALARLRTFELTMEGPAGVSRFSVEVAEDPAGYAGAPLWVTLPEPVEATCMSLVLGEVFTAHGSPARTAVAEVSVYTDLDFEGGAARVVESLDRPDSEVLLRALGAEAVPLLRQGWEDLDGPARRRAVRVLADLESPEAADLLLRAALGADESAAAEGRRGLVAIGDGALPALAPELGSEVAPRRLRAARILGDVGTAAAVTALARRLAAAPEADLPALREALREGLSGAAPPVRRAALDGASPPDMPAARSLLLLGALGVVAEGERVVYGERLDAAWRSAESFEDRYRVLALAARAGAGGPLLDLVLRVAGEEEDPYLRAQAIESLGALASGNEGAVTVLEGAAAAEEVRHRLAAARALGRAGASSSPALRQLLTSDSWPIVRAAAAESLVAGSGGAPLAVLRGALADPSPYVQVRIAGHLGRLGGAEVVEPLAALARDDDADVDARRAAARALGVTCMAEARPVLEGLVEGGAARDSTPSRARAGASAALALSRFRGEGVTALLVRAARGGPPGQRLAAIEALGRRAEPVARQTLEALSEDPMPPIAAAAAAALRQADSAADAPPCPSE